MEVNLQFGPGMGGQPYRVQFGPTRQTAFVNGQLDQVVQPPPTPGIPPQRNGLLSGAGVATFQVALGPSSRYLTIFLQAEAGPLNLPVYSNVNTILVAQ